MQLFIDCCEYERLKLNPIEKAEYFFADKYVQPNTFLGVVYFSNFNVPFVCLIIDLALRCGDRTWDGVG